MKLQIIILGGGFGGLSAFLYLQKHNKGDFTITIVDKNDYHFYHPNIYEVATAFLDDKKINNHKSLIQSVCLPIKEIIETDDRSKLITDEITNISFNPKQISLKSGSVIQYDYLILALGSETNYFDIKNAEKYSLSLKNIDDTLKIKKTVEEVLEKNKDKTKEIKIIIAGGGFTGLELASELIFFTKKILETDSRTKSFLTDPRSNQKVKISIIEACSVILPSANEKVRKLAMDRLEKLGLEIKFNSPIKKVNKNSIILDNPLKEKIDFDILIWTTGITPPSIIKNIDGLKLKNSCIFVDQYLNVGNLKNIFAIGDNSFCENNTGNKIPATAYHAIDQGKIAAQNIIKSMENKPLINYRPRPDFLAIPLGAKYAIVDLKFTIISGLLGWLIRQLISLKYFLTIFPFFKAMKLWFSSIKIFIKND
ncbi:NAD(P)/FAD-dependent oxidoreductase [Candidatus Azambacteria bacterium]|nr:NAD(P)/FAD-dependent oxidoreductase [Candidatus Azambacteria bacterium]